MTGRGRPLRVLLLLGRSTGGIGTHVADLRDRLRAFGVHVEVATDPTTAAAFGWAEALPLWPGAAPPAQGRAAPRSSTVPRWPTASRGSSGAWPVGTAPGRVARVASLRGWCARADVVHAHGHQAGLLAAAVRASLPRGRRPALVISLHNELPTLTGTAGRTLWIAATSAVRSAGLVTGASSDLVTWARAAGARRAELVAVPSPRVPALLAAGPGERGKARRGIRADLGLEPGQPLVATISRIAPQKDLGTLVAASALLPGLAWVVAGSGGDALLARARQHAGDRGAPVRFLGAIDDPQRLLLAADVFVLTSHWEARALVVQEAMAAGTPVVASAVGGIPDLLGDIGTLVPPGDPRAIADAVAALLGDPCSAADQAARGRARARTWPDGQQAARAWLGAYEELLA